MFDVRCSMFDGMGKTLDETAPGGGGEPVLTHEIPSEPGPRGGVGEGLLTSVKRLSCLEAHSTRRLAATLPRRI